MKKVRFFPWQLLVLFITILLCSNTIKAQRLYSESGDFYEKSKRELAKRPFVLLPVEIILHGTLKR